VLLRIFFINREQAIEIISAINEMRERSNNLRCSDRTIVFVPTMGYLHEGHLSLIREGLKHGDFLIVSIFINPTQFGPAEDLSTYPRDLTRDIELAEKEGAALLFTPSEDNLYPENYQTYVKLEALPNYLCGVNRPVHFRGVATIVTKLFNIVNPHVAVFGRKDYQQLLILKQMTRDLNFGIRIVGSAIVREPDGLAMSSRNANLKPELRSSALALFKSLNKAQKLLKKGIKDACIIITEISDFISSHPETEIDYVSICDSETLESVDTIEKQALMALAVKVGSVRLIDNMMLIP